MVERPSGHVELTLAEDVKDALHNVHRLAIDDPSVARALRQWWDGRRGPMLEASYTGEHAGTYLATLTFTESFAEFLAGCGVTVETMRPQED